MSCPVQNLSAFEKRADEAERLIQELQTQVALVKAARNQPASAAPASIPGDFKNLVLEGLAEIQASAEKDAQRIQELEEKLKKANAENDKHKMRIVHLLRNLEIAEAAAEAAAAKI